MRFSIIASALVAALVGFGGTLAVIVESTRHLGATPDQTTSWVVALCIGMGATSAWLSLRYRMPIVTAWSLAGAVLIIATPVGTTLGQAIAAAIFAGALTVLAGSIPAFGAFLGRLPASIAGGMLAGLLLRFAIGLFVGAQTAPALVLPLVGIFMLARLLHPASAPLIVIVLALPLAWFEGYALPSLSASLPRLLWMPPELAVSSLLSLGVPLFLVTMATQQISGVAVLRTSGYTPPVGPSFVITGLATILLAPVGGFSINLSSVTASICTGPDTHPDPAKRYLAGPIYGLCYLVFALGGGALASFLLALPPILVAAVAGIALIAPLTGALATALHRESERFPAVLAFVVTASNMSLFGVGGAFWGLLAGVAALGLDRLGRR